MSAQAFTQKALLVLTLFGMLTVSSVALSDETPVPVTVLPVGTFKIDTQHEAYANNQPQELVVSRWAETRTTVSGKILYYPYETQFQIVVTPEAEGSNIFVGEGSLVSGACSWPFALKIVAFEGKLYLSENSPNVIYTNCAGTPAEHYIEAPYLLVPETP